MATPRDYTALIAIWPSLAGNTTQKLASLNAMTIATTPSPLLVNSWQVYNAIVPSEFQALTDPNKQLVRDIIGQGVIDASNGGRARDVLLQVFAAGSATRAAFAAMQGSLNIVQPWWQANGYGGPITTMDLAAAGGLT